MPSHGGAGQVGDTPFGQSVNICGVCELPGVTELICWDFASAFGPDDSGYTILALGFLDSLVRRRGTAITPFEARRLARRATPPFRGLLVTASGRPLLTSTAQHGRWPSRCCGTRLQVLAAGPDLLEGVPM